MTDPSAQSLLDAPPPPMGAGHPLVLSYGPVGHGGADVGERWRINLDVDTINRGDPRLFTQTITRDEPEQAQDWARQLIGRYTDLRVRAWTVQAQADGTIWYVAALDRVAVHLTIVTESGRTHRLWGLTPARAVTILGDIRTDTVIEIPAATLDRPDEELMAVAHESAQGHLIDASDIVVYVPTSKIDSVVRVTAVMPYDPAEP